MSWFNVNYLYKKPLTVDHTKVSGGSDLSNFPVLISLTDTTLKTVANGGNVQNSSGYDIIFTDSTETTKLDHEIESYTASTGAIVMWVRIPTLSASADTVIYLYCDNPAISTSQENITGVWETNFKGVYHLKETSGAHNDSTSNANNSSSVTVSTQGSATGKIDGADTLTGSSSNNVTVSSLYGSPSSITVSGWGNLTTNGTNGSEFINIGNYVVLRLDDSGGAEGIYYIGSSTWNVLNTSANYTGTGMHYFAFVIDGVGHTQTFYTDSVQKGQTTFTQAIVYTGQGTTTLFGKNGSDTLHNFTGTIDEIRIAATARSAGWLTTEYNNQSSPSTFFTVGVATQLASFTDALTISASRSMTIQPLLVDGLTAISSFSKSESYQAVDGLTISDVPAMQSWHIDALTLADQAMMQQTATFTDGLATTDSLATTEALSATEALTAVSSVGATAAVQASELLTIASALLEQSNYQTIDQATISSAFSSTPTFAPTDLLNIGSILLQTETSTWSDVLSISSKVAGNGGFVPSDVLSGLSQIQETDVWTMLDALSIADSATWTQDNLGVPTTTYSFLEQLSISSFFAAVISSLFPEGLSISSQATSSNGYATSDALSILSSFIKADEGVFAEPLMLTETTITDSTYQSLDQLIISAALQNTSSMQANELLSVLSSLLGTDAIAIIEPLTVTDSATMTQQSIGATYSFLEQLVISSLFNGVQVATLTDAQTIQSSLKIQVVSSFSDLLAIADTGQIAQTSPFVIPLYARSTLKSRDGRVVLLCRDGRVILVSRGDR